MAARKNCILCDVEYEVCTHCPQTIKQTPWRQLCDSSRHFQIYMIVKSLRSDTLKNFEAKEQLAHLKVTVEEVKTFVPSVQDVLLPLFETEPVVMSGKKAKKVHKYSSLEEDNEK